MPSPPIFDPATRRTILFEALRDPAQLLAHARVQGIAERSVPKALLVTQQIPILGSGRVGDAATLEMAPEARPLP